MSEKRLILVVEDERTISNFICRALTANDYKAMSATTGKEALSLFFSHRPDLVLLDLGAQYGYYSADISRTFPVSGKFTERQRVFYDIVLKAHDEVLKILKPGVPYARINELVHEIYAKELKALGLIEKDEEVRKYYYHNTSHFLGLDTHDVGRREGLLEEGMVITVEPGLYIEEEGIGIRLENDILITKDGMENLSKDIPIRPEEVEAFLAGR